MKKKSGLLMCLGLVTLLSCNGENLTSQISSASSGSSSSIVSVDSSNTSESSSIINENGLHKSNEFNGIVKQNISILSEVSRSLPEMKNEGLASYPKYGEDFENRSLYDSIYEENNKLIASPTTYDEMDAEGNLFLNGSSISRKLYKHTASVGLYGGDVLDSEKAYSKKIEISPRKTGNYITGCYAPAGEIIKIEVSSETLAKNPNLKVSVGQTTQNGANNAIPTGNTLTRMPNITNVMNIKKEVTYVGSYFGGPIYVDGIASQNKKVELTISGAVNYSCLIYGNTTKQDYELYSKSSAPYFDLEVFDKSVRHSGTKDQASKYSYEELLNAAKLWKNISSVSNQIPGGSNKDIGITFLYDTYVIYGVAVAQVGLNYIQCYRDWLSGALDYESFVKNGSWGHIHEYNHHFQDYLKLDGEATNNAISLIEYYLFTNVSQNRTEDYPVSGDWNLFADPYRSLSITKENQDKGERHDELNEFADILYSFGYEIFVNAAKKCQRVDNYDQWFKALCEESGYDMTYYFTKIINKTISSSALEYAKGLNLPTFIPVASLYQTGRVVGGQDKMTVLPFIVDSNNYTLNLNKYLIAPNGFTYVIDGIRNKDNITITKSSANVYDVSFTGEETGNIYVDVTLQGEGITSNVTLILGLSKNYRDLSKVASPYNINRDTSNVIDARNTKVVDYSKPDGYYVMSSSGIENINNGDDVDIFYSVNFDLHIKPFEITMDMNEVALVNKLKLCQGFTTALNGPSRFTLYGGKELDNMSSLGEYEVTYVGNYASVEFDPTEIRYFKLVITAQGENHLQECGDISLSRLEMSLDFGNGKKVSPFDDSIYVDDKISKVVNVESTYGYLLNSNNGKIEYNYNGGKTVLFFDSYENAKITIDDQEYNVDKNIIIIDKESSLHNLFVEGTYSLDSIIVVD